MTCGMTSVHWKKKKKHSQAYTPNGIRSGRLKNSRRPFPMNFAHFTSQVGIFFVDERKTKILGLEDVMERGIIKFLTFVIRQVSSIIFGKYS